jgi:hypothetical protein
MKTTITKCDCCQEERREGCGTQFAQVRIDYVDVPEGWDTNTQECVFVGSYPSLKIDICFECAKRAGIVKFKDKPKTSDPADGAEELPTPTNTTNEIEF